MYSPLFGFLSMWMISLACYVTPAMVCTLINSLQAVFCMQTIFYYCPVVVMACNLCCIITVARDSGRLLYFGRVITVARDSGRLLYFSRVIFYFLFYFFYFFSVHQIFDIPGPIFAKLYHTTRYVLK